MFNGLVTFTSVSDNKGNVYSNAVPDTIEPATNAYVIRQEYKANGTGGAGHTFTGTLSNNYYITISVFEISGAATSLPLDQTAVGADNTGTSHTTASTGTTAQANELLTGNGTGGDSRTYACGGTYTQVTNVPDDSGTSVSGLIACYRIVSSVSTYTFDWTTSGISRTAQGVATWKEAATSGTRQKCIGCGTDKKVIGP